MPTCPYCKNTDDQYFHDNGLSRSNPSFTMLCVAPVEKGTESASDFIDYDDPDSGQVGVCGHQWEPNEEDDSLDDEADGFGDEDDTEFVGPLLTPKHLIRIEAYHRKMGHSVRTYRVHSPGTGRVLFEGSAWSNTDALNRAARNLGLPNVTKLDVPANYLVVKTID